MNKVAVVTGAARGIGLAVAQALLRDGLIVVGVDVNGQALVETARRLAEDGAPFLPKTADLSRPEEVARVFAEIDAELGGVDALVNNAGTCFVTDFVEISAEELRRQMSINFDSAFYCCQRAIPRMLKRPGVKKIVNISSNGAYNFDVFDPAHYRASKAALDNLTKHLARRYAEEGVAVNSVAPAMTRTDLFDVVEPGDLERALAGMPRGAPMEPGEIAAWVAFLVSPAGDCASGNVIILNQGRDVR
ncbi:MAG: SDR family oxidoreductase [Deinococcota bacterium]|nr:SDR family oxidoreductase [Deinococcota bacterium]